MAGSLIPLIKSGILLAGVALEPLHPGAGRSPGIVDLPVERDEAGYPVVPRSEVKGALKTLCIHTNDCLKKYIENKCKNDRESGRRNRDCEKVDRISCNISENKNIDSCLKCCCLWGPEPDEADIGISKLIVTDLVPVFYPARSYSGAIYLITTPWLLSKLQKTISILAGYGVNVEVDGDLSTISKIITEIINKINDEVGAEQNVAFIIKDTDGTSSNGANNSASNNNEANSSNENETVQIVDYNLEIKKISDEIENINTFREFIRKVIEDACSIESDLNICTILNHAKILIVNESIGREIIDQLLYRRHRVRLQLDTKTVVEGALWSEEYIPSFTILFGAILESQYKNKFCKIFNVDSIVSSCDKLPGCTDNGKLYLMVGGKTSLGAGLVSLKVYFSRNNGTDGG